MSGCQMTTKQAARILSAKLVGADSPFTGVVTDTRLLGAGQLFVALKGERFDAHDFAHQAQQAGASALLVERELALSLPQIVVKDTLMALGQLASAWRARFHIPIVAVTGSNGKTTVKEMLAAIFRQQGCTLATKGNLNNHIGVPLTLLGISPEHHAAVIEMGANHPGEIAYLTHLTKPTVAVISNAAAAHLEGFGSLQGVANAKGEIYQGLQNNGVAVINADDDFASLWHQLASGKKITTFGLINPADVTCQWKGNLAGNELHITTPAGPLSCRLRLLGRHNIMNALAACAAAVSAGVALHHIADGLQSIAAVPGRLQLKHGVHGAQVLDDTYNANPYSLRAAIDVLTQCSGKKILVLGDMGELGEGTVSLHKQAGEQAQGAGVDLLFAVGKFTRYTVEEFGDGARHFDSHDDLVQELNRHLTSDAVVLVKGSRLMRMERVVEAIVNSQVNKGD